MTRERGRVLAWFHLLPSIAEGENKEGHDLYSDGTC